MGLETGRGQGGIRVDREVLRLGHTPGLHHGAPDQVGAGPGVAGRDTNVLVQGEDILPDCPLKAPQPRPATITHSGVPKTRLAGV